MTATETPTGPQAASGAPNTPAGFADTFTSRFVDAGDVRLHAVVGGDGPAILLVHGWPETWYAWRFVMPVLARDYTVVAVDQRGIGLSDKPAGGYDTATIANDLVALMDALGHGHFAIAGVDTGMPIAYAVAADHPDRVARLIVGEAPLPGVSPSPPLFLPTVPNQKFWHLMFNQLTNGVNVQLVTGREDIFLGAEFETFAGKKKLPPATVQYYVDVLRSGPDALRGSFGWYQAIQTTVSQNEKRKETRLTMPVLAVGGELSNGANAGNTMKLVADDVQIEVIPDSGHWMAEEAPDALTAILATFLKPFRDAPRPESMR